MELIQQNPNTMTYFCVHDWDSAMVVYEKKGVLSNILGRIAPDRIQKWTQWSHGELCWI